ncbi:hypothetical protein G3580_07885 [Nitrogeniibacter mangrovi]|uniref:Uncharacterized protein n=1 Tax=Nitrogeniibacter mangrovi TaxID=2016596 RepID=A0A6C1B1S4_9RHOO|nr:hypothetical protein [Nitrogeniibacter mangrovi]QID17572.1 hypothetical protein G3580_07885 [Nitrogeniibacter mangrovi]
MCFLDSPVGRCEAVREMVLLDETQAECAREHACPAGRQCPLDGCFYHTSGVSEQTADAIAETPHAPA